MKIAILGTRGIPNHYSGFEQFAEFFSIYLAKEGHDVYVYSSSNHLYKEKLFQGVNLIHCYDPENIIGTTGQFIYDFNCVIDSRKRNFDVILQLGYTSNSIWGWLLPKKSVIVTNMDGLEWKRSKYSPLVQKFLKYAEKLAVKTSDYLISDSLGIQKYLFNKYHVQSEYIPYGADNFYSSEVKVLEKYEVQPYKYDMLIARFEPENNLETILDGVELANNNRPFLVIGKHDINKFGKYLKMKFKASKKIRFLGGIYNLEHLNNLRSYSNLYFHGHSVGGTNPSLLEAMASGAFIIAHDNDFNKSILNDNGFYFKNEIDVKKYLEEILKKDHQEKIDNNYSEIKEKFSWKLVNRNGMEFLIKCNKSKKR